MKKEHAVRKGLFFVLVAALTGAAFGCVGAPETNEATSGAIAPDTLLYGITATDKWSIDLGNNFELVPGTTQAFAFTLLSAPTSKNDQFTLVATTYTDNSGVMNNNLGTVQERTYIRGPGNGCDEGTDECWRHHVALAVQAPDSNVTVSVAGAQGQENVVRYLLVRRLPNGTPTDVAELDLAACTDIPENSRFELRMYDVDYAKNGEQAPLGGSFALENRHTPPSNRHIQNIYLDQLWGTAGTIYRVKVMYTEKVLVQEDGGQVLRDHERIGFFDLVLRPGNVNYPCTNGVDNVFSSFFIDGSNRY